MTGNQMMDYHVWPQHLYSHGRTCTCSISCRRPSSLVAFHICYHLDCASVHEISALVTWFQCMLDIFSFHGDSDLLYIVRGDDHTCHILYIMPIHGHYTLMYLRLLYVFVAICRDWLLYYTDGWLVLPLGSSSLHFWDGFIMYFGHHVTPLTSHIRGHLLQLILPHMVDHTFMAFPIPLQTLWAPWTNIVPLMFPRSSLKTPIIFVHEF